MAGVLRKEWHSVFEPAHGLEVVGKGSDAAPGLLPRPRLHDRRRREREGRPVDGPIDGGDWSGPQGESQFLNPLTVWK